MKPAIKASPIDLTILSPSADHSQRLVTLLRNGGLAVHFRRVDDLDELREALEEDQGDLLLVCAYEPGVDLSATLALLANAANTPATIVLYGEQDAPEELFVAMRNGVRDLVGKDNTAHLQLVVLREFADLETRREVERLRRRLIEAEERCMGLVERSREAIAFVQDGMYIRVNQAYQELFGVSDRADLEDMPVLDSIAPEAQAELKAAFRTLEHGKDDKEVELELVIRKPGGDGPRLPFHLNRAQFDGEPGVQIVAYPPEATSGEPPPPEATTTSTAASPAPPESTQILAQAEPKRRPLASTERLTAAIEQRLKHPTNRLDALMLIDLDGIQQQPPEDRRRILETLAAPLEPIAGEKGVIAWFGTEGLALLLDRQAANEIDQAAREILEHLNQAELPPGIHALAARIGYELITGGDAHSVLKHAHQALSQADADDPVRIYRPPLARTPEAEDRDDPQIKRIDDALSGDRLQLMFQPIVSLQGDTRENYSVLVRLQEPDGKILLPELFLPDAERSGRMLAIDRWVIRNAIRRLAKHRGEGKKVNFFITLSRDSILEPETLIWICDCLRESHARGGWITFQIDETVARDLNEPTERLVQGLKKIKCQIALDHFGQRPGGETLLANLGADFAKISPEFTQGLSGDRQKQDRVAQLNELIQKQGAKTIATGVEDANCLTALWTVGIGYIQGFFLQEPSASIEYGIEAI